MIQTIWGEIIQKVSNINQYLDAVHKNKSFNDTTNLHNNKTTAKKNKKRMIIYDN